jgi:uroporphyrinogen decarboxylase
MTSVERLLRAINHEEPDVVPHFELLIHQKVRDAIVPGASYEDFIDHMDIDAACIFDKLAWDYETLDETKRVARDQFGGIIQFTAEDLAIPRDYVIKSQKDAEKYIAPDPDLPHRYDILRGYVKRFKGQRAVVATVTDVFNIAKESLLGETEYFKAMIKNPDLVDWAHETVLNYNLGYIRNCIEVGADIIFITGDWAMTYGPMVSPEFTARFLIPPFRSMVEYVHERGLPVLKHSDGNLWSLFDLIVETGVDGLHPIDPMAGMDIGEAKAKYGDRICLLGNVNCGATLSWGTEEEVRQETKEVIRKAGAGGGLVCMSSNSIHSDVKPSSYVAMIKAIKEYGRYPLELD